MNREEAVSWIKYHINTTEYDDTDELKIALNMAIKALEQDKWIPVSERYPEEEGEEYLVCYDDGTIRIRNLYFTVMDNEPYFDYGQGIVAWSPLPKPYKAEGGDKE